MINLIKLQNDLYQYIKSLGYEVIDEIKKDTPCPYVKIGYSTVRNIGIKNNEAYTMLQYIDVYSRYNGSKEVKEIAYNIYDSIKKHDFSTEEYTVNTNLYHMEFTEEENKEKKTNYRHGILIFKFNVYE